MKIYRVYFTKGHYYMWFGNELIVAMIDILEIDPAKGAQIPAPEDCMPCRKIAANSDEQAISKLRQRYALDYALTVRKDAAGALYLDAQAINLGAIRAQALRYRAYEQRVMAAQVA
jgi:hypothetical protein